MAFSNTTNFAPSLTDIGLQAFQIAGVRPTALTAEHMVSLRMAANLMLSTWSNLPNLWSVTPDPISIPLVNGQPQYSIPTNIVLILDAYIEITNSSSQPVDRIVLPVSRSEYSAYSNKLQVGQVTTYWHNRQIVAPEVNLYQCPDGVSATAFKYYGLLQLQDVTTTNAQQPFIPYVYQEAFTYGLAQRLAEIWSPDRLAVIIPRAKETKQIADDTNIEQAAVYISPNLSGYWRV